MALISVIVTAYQKAQYVGETLDSLLKQSLKDWECIIIDDGSTDNTKEVVESVISGDSRFKYAYQDNEGSSAARNCGARLATAEYIVMLDGDDKFAPSYLENALNAFKADSSIKLVYGAARKFGAKNKRWNLEKYNYDRLPLKNMIYCSFVMRRSDFLETDGYDEAMRHGSEDWEFLLRFLKRDSVVHFLKETSFYYRQGCNAVSDKATANRRKVQDYMVQKNSERYMDINNPMEQCYQYERKIKHLRVASPIELLKLLYKKIRA